MKEVQEYLGVGRESIMQWINKRNMPAYKVGRLWKFKLSEVDDKRFQDAALVGIPQKFVPCVRNVIEARHKFI